MPTSAGVSVELGEERAISQRSQWGQEEDVAVPLLCCDVSSGQVKALPDSLLYPGPGMCWVHSRSGNAKYPHFLQLFNGDQ